MAYVKNTWKKGDKVTSAKLNNMEGGISKAAEVSEVPSINIFNPEDITEGGAIIPWDGSIMPYGGVFYTYIPCEPGTYTFLTPSWFYTGNTGRTGLFDSNKEYLTEILGTVTEYDDNNAIVTITIPSNSGYDIAYFGFSQSTSLLNKLMVVKDVTYPSRFIPYGTVRTIAGLQISMSQIVDLDIEENPLAGKIATFNGDSITAGSGNDNVGYPEIIAELTGLTVENIAVGGATITPGTSAAHIISTSISDMRSDADFAFVSGGPNDADSSVTKGTVTSGYNDTLDTTTFAGAFESMLISLLDRFAGKKIGYICTHKCGNFDEDYFNIAKQACDKWGVAFCDLYHKVPPLGRVSALANAFTSSGDGYHPTQEGYEKLYVPKIIAWMKTL